MINREDMLELTRRMTPSRTSFTRVAGGYMEPDGEIDESFNVNFLNLSAVEKEKNLAIAKAVPFAATNVNLRSYAFGDGAEQRKMRQLLYGMRECGLYYKHVDTLCMYPHAYFYYNKRRIRLVRWDIAPVF